MIPFVTSWLFWIVPAAVAFACVLLYRKRGWAEQKNLTSELGTLSNNEYGVIENLALHASNGIVSIECVIVSPYGVFVVKTFDLKGRINGDESQPVWESIDLGNKESFDNPVMENQRAIEALSEVLAAYPDVPFVSIIGFPSRDVLNVKATVQVTDISKIMDIIRSYKTELLTVPDAVGMAFALRSADENAADENAVLADML